MLCSMCQHGTTKTVRCSSCGVVNCRHIKKCRCAFAKIDLSIEGHPFGEGVRQHELMGTVIGYADNSRDVLRVARPDGKIITCYASYLKTSEGFLWSECKIPE